MKNHTSFSLATIYWPIQHPALSDRDQNGVPWTNTVQKRN